MDALELKKEKEKRRQQVEEADIISRLGGYTGEEDKEISEIYEKYINCEISAEEKSKIIMKFLKEKYGC